jgi:hypothetical protein
MATYVLVHGGGHGGWCYDKVAKLLRGAGHDVYTPTLTGLGERKHLLRADTDLSTHISFRSMGRSVRRSRLNLRSRASLPL